MSDEDNGLIFARKLNAKGGACALDWDGIRKYWDDDEVVWVHLDYSKTNVQEWLRDESGLDPVVCNALISQETRPRCVSHGTGLQINLRGINYNPGASVDDMISLRIWIDHHRLVTFRQRKLLAIEDVCAEVDAGNGAIDASGLLVSLAGHMSLRAGTEIVRLDEAMDELEEETLVSDSNNDLRSRIANLRRTIIGIRRYLSPQRDAFNQLYMENVSWINEKAKLHIRELADKSTRHIEELDSIRDRAAVTHEELLYRLAERTNKIMYTLSIIAGIFLPLGFITGLLGINVGGMPGTESGAAFWVVCIMLVVLVVVEVIYIRIKRWL